jgi:hypothetical protein
LQKFFHEDWKANPKTTPPVFVIDSYNCLVDRNRYNQHEPDVDPQVSDDAPKLLDCFYMQKFLYKNSTTNSNKGAVLVVVQFFLHVG